MHMHTHAHAYIHTCMLNAHAHYLTHLNVRTGAGAKQLHLLLAHDLELQG